MIYKNYSETASLLAQKIKENFDDKNSYSITFISQESESFAKKICELLETDLVENIHPKNLIIVDNGSTLADEYNEFTNDIRKNHPTTKIIFAIPIVPESEVKTLQENCDTLLYLHSDPYFFSLNQFYEEQNF